jgi:alpha-L-rhamnosidase
VCNTNVNGDGTLTVHIEIPFGCQAEVTLPGSGRGEELLSAGSYDFTYEPERDYRKPFDEHTMIVDLAENQEALGILFSLVPPIGGMAKGKDAEFGCCGLEEFRHLSFLPIEADKLEEAIRRIKEITVNL